MPAPKKYSDAVDLTATVPKKERRLRDEMRGYFVQASVEPLDRDGVAIAWIGTVAFIIGTVVCWFFRERLIAHNHGWYLWVGVTGIAIGVFFVSWTTLRKKRIARENEKKS